APGFPFCAGGVTGGRGAGPSDRRDRGARASAVPRPELPRSGNAGARLRSDEETDRSFAEHRRCFASRAEAVAGRGHLVAVLRSSAVPARRSNAESATSPTPTDRG